MLRKDFKKVGIHQMLHSYETWHFPRIDLAGQILKARVSGWTEHARAAPSSTTIIKTSHQKLKITWKNGWQKTRRKEGKTMSSQEYTETHKDQRDDKETGNGGGRQKFEQFDGDFPW